MSRTFAAHRLERRCRGAHAFRRSLYGCGRGAARSVVVIHLIGIGVVSLSVRVVVRRRQCHHVSLLLRLLRQRRVLKLCRLQLRACELGFQCSDLGAELRCIGALPLRDTPVRSSAALAVFATAAADAHRRGRSGAPLSGRCRPKPTLVKRGLLHQGVGRRLPRRSHRRWGGWRRRGAWTAAIRVCPHRSNLLGNLLRLVRRAPRLIPLDVSARRFDCQRRLGDRAARPPHLRARHFLRRQTEERKRAVGALRLLCGLCFRLHDAARLDDTAVRAAATPA